MDKSTHRGPSRGIPGDVSWGRIARIALAAFGHAAIAFGGGAQSIPADLEHQGTVANEGIGTLIAADGETVVAAGPLKEDYLTWSGGNGDWQLGGSSSGSAVVAVDLRDNVFASVRGASGATGVFLALWDGTVSPTDQISIASDGDVEAVAVDSRVLALGRPSSFGGSGRVTTWLNNHGTWEENGSFQLQDSEAYGAALDVDSDGTSSTMVIGIPGGPGDSGRVQVWRRAAAMWTLEGTLTAPGEQADNDFGVAVALDGPWLAVGAPLHDTQFPDPIGTNSGAVYLYRRDASGSWIHTATAVGTDLDHFGAAVAMDRSALAVGSPLDDVGSHPEITNAGRVHLYRRTGGLWGYVAALYAADAGAFDHLGESVAISARGVLGGAPQWDAPGGNSAGVVYTWSGTVPLFVDGFESGNTADWSSVSP